MGSTPGGAAYPQQAAATAMTITPAPGSRLEEWLDQVEAARAAVTEAEQRRDALLARIKGEVTVAHPGTRDFLLAGSGNRRPLRLFWKKQGRLNTGRLKAEQRAVYDAYFEPGGHWELRAADGAS